MVRSLARRAGVIFNHKAVGRAFRHRNYRLYFAGMSVSLVGSWMSTVAASWLVYRLSGSALTLGVTGFAGQIPFLVLAPVSGVFVDRLDRRRLLIVTQAVSMLISFALAALSYRGTITIASVVLLTALRGAVNALDMPARHALVPELIEDKKGLGNAIALNSAMFNGSRLFGPALGGLILAASDETICFLIDGLSYLAIIAALLAIKLPRRTASARRGAVGHEFRDGLKYVLGHTTILGLLLLAASGSIFGASYAALAPIFAKDIFGGGPRLLGLLMAAGGAGAFLGALRLAGRSDLKGIGRTIMGAALSFSLALFGLALAPRAWLGAVFMFCIGAGMVSFAASINTVVQTLVEDAFRGRVMSLYSLAFVGMMPFGSLFGGAAAQVAGCQFTVGAAGAICAAIAVGVRRFLSRLDELPALQQAHPSAGKKPEPPVFELEPE